MTTVLATGTFDILHTGHLDYLRQATEQGDRLVVIIARDETVRKEKNHEPQIPETKRLEQIRAIEIVNLAILGNIGDKFKTILDIKPDVIALGYDQRVEESKLRTYLDSHGMTKTRIMRMQPFMPETFKSTKIREATKSQRSTKRVFIHDLRTLILLAITYGIILGLILIITGSLVIKSCPTCPIRTLPTLIFHLFSLGISFGIISFIIHFWKRITSKFKAT